MTYKNAKNILPESLLREIQQYAEGEVLYIPAKTASRSGWGNRNGTRIQYEERNNLIRSTYSENRSVEETAGKFYLSADTIKKIIKNR